MKDEAKKLKMHIPDLMAENIVKHAALFPNCVTGSRNEKTGTLGHQDPDAG